MSGAARKISVIVPVRNEEWSIRPLYGKLTRALSDSNLGEIIFVDDGSTDGTGKKLEELASQESIVKIIRFRRNFGLTQAVQAGFDYANGDYIVTISGNLQNEPADIPKLIEKLEEGYDVCVGWPKPVEGELTRAKPQGILNWVISKISGVKLHDYDCMLRAYKNELLNDLQLYGDLERYIPVYVFWKGGTIAEVEVLQHPRSHGENKNKNKTKQTLKIMLDLLMLKFLERDSDRTLYVFGAFGITLCGLGILTSFWMFWLKISDGRPFVETPLPLVTALFLISGILLMVLGVMSGFLARVYHASTDRILYTVKSTTGFSRV